MNYFSDGVTKKCVMFGGEKNNLKGWSLLCCPSCPTMNEKIASFFLFSFFFFFLGGGGMGGRMWPSFQVCPW
jgi:hypothetical protein